MAAPTLDPGIAAMAGRLPCITRRWLGETGNASLLANYNAFPWLGQNIDTPVQRVGARWTSDDDTHPLP